MMTKSYILSVFIFACLFSSAAFGQNRHLFTSGLFPEAQLSYKLNKDYYVTHKVESQHGMFDAQRLNRELEYAHTLTDLQTFIGMRINPFVKVDIGYQYRIEKGENTHRTIQQVAILQRSNFFRIGHRIRADQTFFDTEDLLLRIRYRYALQMPLQGRELDPGEQYLTLSNEVIYMNQDSEDDIENRFVASLGFFVSDKTKYEVGLDYRTDDYLVENRFRSRLWLKFGVYLSL
ncbi:Protein of unknown function (DUF2490) [Belliella baltica DSM 15883]|uniref:Outer membrane protein beta-barrel domain-containing protein n=1 Tax=Belliella baltica (strain DSM 15883 / CIP 108006 / LMG 21964 / BA134) TaxID=866536 RepID=I3Z7B1_BELBD|nr:DUF2490 domain-containing protein [Belliella baltica]AFL85129.1 Protein of unknown function (DUF2490) [Belliella baltica DSM 15883]